MTRAFGFFLLGFGIFACVVGGIFTIFAIDEMKRGNAGMLIAFGCIDAFGIAMIALAVVVLNRTKPAPGSSGAGDDPTGHYPANAFANHELDGTPYTTHYVPPVKGKNAKPSVLTISTPIDSRCEFEMVVEKWYDKFCKRIGVAVEVQTGDEKFDDECYVRSDFPDFTAAYLNDPVKRIAILDLRNFGFLTVAMRDGKLTATWSGFDPKAHHRDDLGSDVASRLLLLARELPPPRPEFEQRTGAHRRFWQVVLWAALVGFAFTLLAVIHYSPTHTFDLILRAIPILLLGGPAFAYLSALLLRGTSRSHLAWGGLMIGALFLFPIGSAGIIGLLNGLLDTSAAESRSAVIVEKYTTRSKNTTHYHVRVQSWRDPGDTESFPISQGEFQAITPHRSKFAVVTHTGGLGIEWIQSKRVIANP